MTPVKPEHINPFLLSTSHVFSQVCQSEPKIGKLSLSTGSINGNQIFIMFGVTGEMTGQVFIIFEDAVAKNIASKMMFGMPVETFDDMAKSALSELGNMIMGNAATYLSNDNIIIDITTPALGVGEVQITSPDTKTLEVPMSFEGGSFRICFMLKLQ